MKAMTMNVLDFWASYTKPITGQSYRLRNKSREITEETVVNSEDELNRMLAAGWELVKNY